MRPVRPPSRRPSPDQGRSRRAHRTPPRYPVRPRPAPRCRCPACRRRPAPPALSRPSRRRPPARTRRPERRPRRRAPQPARGTRPGGAARRHPGRGDAAGHRRDHCQHLRSRPGSGFDPPDPANPATPGNGAEVSTPGATRRGGAPSGPRAGHPRPDAPDPAPAAIQAAPATAASIAAGPAPDPAPAGIAALQQSAPSAPAGPPAADAQPVPRHLAAEQPLASQVAGPVLALRARGDGSHQLMIALHPAELGPVNLHVRISGDAMTISLASSNDIAHDTLAEALPQLRAELQSAGLGSASLSLDLTSGGCRRVRRATARHSRPGQRCAARPDLRAGPAACQRTARRLHQLRPGPVAVNTSEQECR